MSKLNEYWTAAKTKLSTWWNTLLGFFRYSHSILVARLTVLSGFIIAVAGSLDWSPLTGLDITTGFNKAQVIWLGGITMVKGIIDEIARRAKGTQPADL